jgi:AcrR family transcriptional regulator
MTNTTTSQRTLQRESTRRQLVEAGLRVVAASGFAGATTAAIAQATGKAHGTVFVHFRTRDVLVTELVAEVGRVMSARLNELQTAEPTIAEVLTAHLTALQENEVLYSRLLCEASTLPLAARAQIFALQSGIAWRLRGAYVRAREHAGERAREGVREDGRESGVRDIDPVTLSNIWISLTNHYLMNRDLFAPDASVIAQRGADIKAQFLALIKP